MKHDPELLSVRAAATETPGAPALVDGERTLTWSEVADLVAVAAAGFAAREAARSLDTVRVPAFAVVGDTSLATVIALLAAIEEGVPVLLVHPRATEEERQRLLALYDVPLVDVGDLVGPAADVAPRPAAGRARIESGRCLAVVRTSGSRGGPKGVVLSRRALLAAAAASAGNLDWRPDDRWLLQMPTAHVAGLSIVVRCLVARRPMVLAPSAGLATPDLVARLERQRVTLLSLVPTVLRRLLAAGLRPPPALRAVLVGGAAAPRPLLAAAVEAGWPVLATYGLSETCGQVTTQPPRRRRPGAGPAPPQVVEPGCGPPLPGVEVRVVGEARPSGPEGRVEGAIEVHGETLMDGYLPELDTWPFTADGWLVTGDLGWLDKAGNLHVLGRRDDVIVTGGENVHPLEVEEALLEHRGIAAVSVFGVADAEWGEAVAAAVVAAGPERPDDEALRRFLAPRLAAFRRPRRLAWLDALVVGANGKVDRRATAAVATPRLAPF